MSHKKNENKGEVKQQKKEEEAAATETISKEELERLRGVSLALEVEHDKLLRLGAEFENYKKRVAKEREEWIRYAGESFILELLHIVDNFERAFQAADKTQDFKVLHQGVEMILKEIQIFLKEKGVKKIDSVGEQFDPHKHEALEQMVCEDASENTVLEEFQTGYEMNGRVLRTAKVKVSKKEKTETSG